MQLAQNNHQEYKQWVAKTLEDLYKLQGVELIEKSEEFFARCYDENSKIRLQQAQKTNDEAVEKEAADFLKKKLATLQAKKEYHEQVVNQTRIKFINHRQCT
jgi:hypothetical protein